MASPWCLASATASAAAGLHSFVTYNAQDAVSLSAIAWRTAVYSDCQGENQERIVKMFQLCQYNCFMKENSYNLQMLNIRNIIII